MKLSNILLYLGFAILLVGAVLSVCEIESWSNYVLIAGATLVILRGAVRVHEKDDSQR